MRIPTTGPATIAAGPLASGPDERSTSHRSIGVMDAVGLDLLLGPLRYGFMLRGLAAAVLVGIVCAAVGTFVVLRGMAFFGDALAHAILPGVAIGYLVAGGATAGAGLFWWALGAALVASVGIGAIARAGDMKEDTAIGIVFAAMFALGIALISQRGSYAVDLAHLLFGDVLGVGRSDLILTVGLGAVVLLLILAFFKEFVLVSFDPTLATTLRLPTDALDFLLLGLIAVTIVAALQTVGVALMVAMLVTPPATARLLTDRLSLMIVLAGLIGAGSGVVGLYGSYYIGGIPSGAAIVLAATAFFLAVLAVQRLTRAIRFARERR